MMMVVQRMTLLMALCTLAGLTLYVKGRAMVSLRPHRGFFFMSAGVGIFGLIGIFFKEPAILICAYIIALELTLLRRLPRPPRYWKMWLGLFVVLPLATVALYFFHDLEHLRQLYLKRDFSLGERLLTESRVLIDYLRILLIPSLGQTGPYQDDFVISRSIFEPLSTIFAITAIAISLFLALLWAKRLPIVSFGVLWFFLGHSLESTFLPLELYFEHRNYLPSLGIFFSLVVLIGHLSRRLRPIYLSALGLFFGLSASISAASSSVWGDEMLMAQIWSAEHPKSLRAQVFAINYWARRDKARTLFHLSQAIEHNPSKPGLYVHQFLLMRCGRLDGLNVEEPDLEGILPNGSFDHLSLSSLALLRKGIYTDDCRASEEELVEIIDLLLQNPHYAGNARESLFLYTLRAQLLRNMGDFERALTSLEMAYQGLPRFEIALTQAWYAYKAGRFEQALMFVEKARDTPVHKPYVLLWKSKSIGSVEERILQARRQRSSAG
jgi:hypothetical protein